VKCSTRGGPAKNGPISARHRAKRSVARKFWSCASTESHSTSSTKRSGVSMPLVIRTERQPGAPARIGCPWAYAAAKSSSRPG
jgi:hypothetical protein